MAITLTANAAQRVKQYLSSQDEAVALRFGVRKSGCSGFAYFIELTNHIDPRDLVFESNAVKVVVDPASVPYVDGTEIDYGGDQLSASFRFRNPNVKNQCGCGESFAV